MLKVGYYRTEIYIKVQVSRIDGYKLRAYELHNEIAYANKTTTNFIVRQISA